MDFKYIKCFQQVYRDGSIQKASQSLFISQQAVSRMIINMEEELGSALFIRGARGVTPTEHGKLFMSETEQAMASIDAAIYKLRSRNRAIGGTVRFAALLGHMGSRSRLNINAISQCRQAFPGIELIDQSASPNQIEDDLSGGRLDFAFSAFPDRPSNFICVKLFDFRWYMAMGHDNPLAGRQKLEVTDLSRQKLVFPKQEQYDRLQIMHALPGESAPTFIDAMPMLYDVVFQQVLPLRAMMLCAEPHAPLLNPEIIRLVPFVTDKLRSQIYLLTKKATPLSDAARQVLDFLLNAWRFYGIDISRDESGSVEGLND